MAKDFSINSRIESKIHRILSETIIHEIKDQRLKDLYMLPPDQFMEYQTKKMLRKIIH